MLSNRSKGRRSYWKTKCNIFYKYYFKFAQESDTFFVYPDGQIVVADPTKLNYELRNRITTIINVVSIDSDVVPESIDVLIEINKAPLNKLQLVVDFPEQDVYFQNSEFQMSWKVTDEYGKDYTGRFDFAATTVPESILTVTKISGGKNKITFTGSGVYDVTI